MSSSRNGARAERKAASRYGFQLIHNEWRDGCYGNDTPVQVKAAQASRSSGREGRVRLWKEDHQKLVRQSGYYVFVKYRERGTGIQVLDMVQRKAKNVHPNFYSSGNHPHGNQQSKIPLSDIF